MVKLGFSHDVSRETFLRLSKTLFTLILNPVIKVTVLSLNEVLDSLQIKRFGMVRLWKI